MAEAASWSDFFVAQVGAAAALAGLLFVAISINLERILAVPQLPSRAAEMLLMLVGAMITSSFCLIPAQRPIVLGVQLVVAGAAMAIGAMIAQVRSLANVKSQTPAWWVWRLLIVPFTSAPILIGGMVMIAGGANGLYWIASGVLITLSVTVLNAWILLIEIKR
ncbi:MAG TPA: hypothetical protein VGM57_07910 [Pseudolabrys sp.]|jgi:modulator of FtsH protease